MGNAPSPLRTAVRWNDVQDVQKILDKAGDRAPHLINDDFSQDCIMQSCTRADGNALYYAVQKNRVQVVQLMIERGADVHSTGMCGETCVQRAARNNFMETAKVLVQAGSDVNATDDRGHHVIHCCGLTPFDTTPFIKWWLEEIKSKEDVHLRDFSGRTPLHEAAHCGNYAVCHTLLEYGADVNAVSNEGNTPLHGRGVTLRPGVWQLLVDRGADVTATNKSGQQPKPPAART